MTGRSHLTRVERRVLAALAACGVLCLVYGAATGSARIWQHFLVDTFCILSLALGGAVFVSIQHVANAGWGAALKRVPEALMRCMPAGAAALLLTFWGRGAIYPWAQNHGALPGSKAAYLSSGFFYGRMAFVLASWIIFALLLLRESRRQDADASLVHTFRSRKLAGGFLVVFALTFSLASFDWLMSVEPEFYSTIYAFYNFSGLFVSGIAAVTLACVFLRYRGYLPAVTTDHLHNLGKLLFAFSTFWAYMWLCQFLLIYYTNLPEETIYYARRTATPGWTALFLLNIALNWVIPFITLLSRGAKRSPAVLGAVCAILLAGRWLDLYLMVVPGHSGPASVGILELGLAAGFAAFFVLYFDRALAQSSLIPVNDPYLAESLSAKAPETAPERPLWSRQAKAALGLSTGAFGISFAVWGLVGALAPHFRQVYGLSPLETSALIAVPVLLGSLGRIPMGILADRFGGRLVFSALLISCMAAAIGASSSGSYPALLFWALLIGLAGTSFSVGVAFASRWFASEHQGTALGIYGVGNIGQSLVMFAAPALVAATGSWRLPFWLFGAAAGLFGVAFFLAARNAPAAPPPKRTVSYFALFSREPLAWTLSLFYFLTFGGFVALSIYLPTLLHDTFHLAMADAGARVAGFVVVATLMRPVGGFLADRHGGAQVLGAVMPLAAAMALGLTSDSMVVFTVAALSLAALLGAGNGAVFKLVPDCFPRHTGAITGLVGAAGGLGGFFPPLVMGFMKLRTGSYDVGFILLCCFALFCAAVNYLVFLRPGPAEREAAQFLP